MRKTIELRDSQLIALMATIIYAGSSSTPKVTMIGKAEAGKVAMEAVLILEQAEATTLKVQLEGRLREGR
jgi:hypothetical protein